MALAPALLSTTCFGPVQWYQKLYRHPQVWIEAHESFVKQTYRNRFYIATAQGVQALTVPVSVQDEGRGIAAVRISDHGNWRHRHWQAITSAYGDSPFLEYYEDDLRPFFTQRRWEYLLDYNEDICRTMCALLDIHPWVKRTSRYEKNADFIEFEKTADFIGETPWADFREAIRPKHPAEDESFQPKSYYQVFQQRQGFLPNLSILDLLLCMGPEAIFYL